MQEPLPPIHKAYSLVLQQEQQLNGAHLGDSSQPSINNFNNNGPSQQNWNPNLNYGMDRTTIRLSQGLQFLWQN